MSNEQELRELVTRIRQAATWQKGIMPSVANGWADELEALLDAPAPSGGEGEKMRVNRCDRCLREVRTLWLVALSTSSDTAPYWVSIKPSENAELCDHCKQELLDWIKSGVPHAA
jgi:hypothetical protein